MKLSTVQLFKMISLKGSVQLDGELLRKYQLALIDIAKDIISVCEKYDVNYHLTGGTALGAHREHGFIPWDDDIDIDLLGSDFDKFAHYLSEEFGDKYYIQTCHTPDVGMAINRVRLKNSVFRTREDIGREECGFFVDVMRIENTYNNFLLRGLHGFACMCAGLFLSCRNFYKNRQLMKKLAEDYKEVKGVFRFKTFLGWLISFISVERCAEITQFWYGLCKNNNSKYVTVPAGKKHFFGELRKRCDFVETTTESFEGYEWKVPKDIEGYLTSMFGDYKKIPPVEEREKHILLELKFPDEQNN